MDMPWREGKEKHRKKKKQRGCERKGYEAAAPGRTVSDGATLGSCGDATKEGEGPGGNGAKLGLSVDDVNEQGP